VLVHHEPLERVTDDDMEYAGDMLKDAMMQERISGWIHEDERRTALLELEPTPEVHVGSLAHALAQESGFERISDSEDSEEQQEIASPEVGQSEAGKIDAEQADVAHAVAAPTEDSTEEASTAAIEEDSKYHAATELLADWQTTSLAEEKPQEQNAVLPEPEKEPLEEKESSKAAKI